MEQQFNSSMITEYMTKNGLTKKEFCAQCNISVSTLDRIMHGKNYILTSLFRIAKTMNVKVHEFFR